MIQESPCTRMSYPEPIRWSSTAGPSRSRNGSRTTISRELPAGSCGSVTVCAVLPRTGAIRRADASGRSGEQVLPANVDTVPPSPEIDELAQYCRFTDCSHETEPGCAVHAAVDCGDLDARRVESHRKLRRENEWIAARSDARLRHERTREIKVMSRAIRAYYRDR